MQKMTNTESQPSDLTGVTFISDKPQLRLCGVPGVKENMLRFVNGSFYTENTSLIEFLRKYIKNKPQISKLIREIDMSQAAKVVHAFEQESLNRHRAVKGGFTAGMQQEMLRTSEAGKAMAMDEAVANNLNPEAGVEMAEQIGNAMQVTEESSQIVKDGAGFIPDPAVVAANAAKDVKVAEEVKNVTNLLKLPGQS